MSWSDNNNNDPWGSSGNGSGRRGPGPNMDDVNPQCTEPF